MARHFRETSPKPKSPSLEPGRSAPLENLITCSGCGFVYDTRFLAEYCRMVDGEGYHCRNCDALLTSI